MRGTTPTELLTIAHAVCDGQHPVPGMSQSRAACLITRQALELIVDALLANRQFACPDASTRTRMICLAVAYEKDGDRVGHRAETAWRRLSAACHHHAYELSPTRGETKALLEEVAWLDELRTGSL